MGQRSDLPEVPQWLSPLAEATGPSPRIVDTGFVANLVGFYLRRRPRNHRD